MKKWALFLLCGVFCLAGAFIVTANKAEVCYVDENMNVMALAPDIGSYTQFVTFLSQNPNIHKVSARAGNLYVRVEEGICTALVATDEGYILLFFDDAGEYLYHKVITFSSKSCREKLDQVEAGTTYTEIYAIDPA